LSNNGKVYATGRNNYGQLGLGDNGTGTNRDIFTEVTFLGDKNITSIATGYDHSFALSNDGKVYAAGYNSFGQLGLGNNVNRNSFTEVTFLNDKNITAIAVGYYHSLVLTNDGKVYATGFNDYGQLGLGNNTDSNSFTEVTFLSDKNITSIAAGEYHSLVLTNDGKVYAVGYNNFGQLGLSSNADCNSFTEVISISDVSLIATGNDHSFALTNDGKVYAAGLNNIGGLGLGNNANRDIFTEVIFLGDKNITAIDGGVYHSFALTNDGKVYAAGGNSNGQLGLGNNANHYNFTEVTSVSGVSVIAAGYYHSFALSNNGKVYATGRNDYGQLGLGDNDIRKNFTEVRF
jgi:alpha-tubulin suppressor-like RCC1 family protein